MLLESWGLVLKAFLFSLENWSQCPRHHHASLSPRGGIRLQAETAVYSFLCSPLLFFKKKKFCLFVVVVVVWLLWLVTVSGFFSFINRFLYHSLYPPPAGRLARLEAGRETTTQ